MKVTLFFAFFLFTFQLYGSVLSDAAANCPVGSFVKMPANQSLQSLNLEYSIFYYNDSGCWDPVNKRVRWVGSPGTCCASPAIFKMLEYSEAADSWTIGDTPFSGSGHGYDGNAVDPNTGDLYFTKFKDATIHRHDGTNWSTLPASPLYAAAAMALAWFPEINGGQGGLVHVTGGGDAAWFDGSAWNRIPAPPTGWGAYHVFAQYNPQEKFVWLGGGNNAERVTYRLNPDLTYTRFADAPFDLRPARSIQSVDPVTGKFVVSQNSDDSFWEFDPVADKWSQITGVPGQPTEISTWQVPIPEYGVIMFIWHRGSNREVYLYKHKALTPLAVDKRPRREARVNFSLSPNPFRSTLTVALPLNTRNTVVRIFNSAGVLIKTKAVGTSPVLRWDTSRMPRGAYVVKMESRVGVVSKRVFKN